MGLTRLTEFHWMLGRCANDLSNGAPVTGACDVAPVREVTYNGTSYEGVLPF